jgi:hypothetical protein
MTKIAARLLIALALSLLPALVPAREPARPILVDPLGDQSSTHSLTAPAPPGGAPTDTIYLLGGPGQLSGKFQDAAGLPDRQGWVGVDHTLLTIPRWNIDTFNAANLDPQANPNHAWWCGETFTSCLPGDPPEGYGNNWAEWLDWYGRVPDPTQSVTVRLTARLNYDVEPVEDYLYLGYIGAVWGWEEVTSFTHQGTGVQVDETFTVDPMQYVGPDSNQVHLRWVVQSDGAWSDEDCTWPTAGAAQLDSIAVYFDQGGGEALIGEIETCEPGDPVQWQAAFPPQVGDFSQVWPLLDDLDPAHANDTPQFAFIDDGHVVPGTGGYLCTSWCYGPNNFIVNPEGGLAGPYYHLENDIWSPPLAHPGGNYTGAQFACDVYLHEEFDYTSPGMAFVWHVRSTADPQGQDGWTEWQNRNEAFIGGPYYLRVSHAVADLLVPDCHFVQLALGVRELGHQWGIDGTDGTPAPYIDNVSFKVYERAGPALLVVQPDGSGDYSTIQAAVNAASDQDIIELGDGVFTGSGNRDINYYGKAITVRSQSDNPLACIIDCQGNENESHRGFHFASGEGAGSVLAGVTVQNGYVTNMGGGAIYCRDSSPTIQNCHFLDNTGEGSSRGGSLYVRDGGPLISDCVFARNSAYLGGGLYCRDSANPTLINCTFAQNSASYNGPAIYLQYGAALTLENCIIAFNGPTAGGAVTCGSNTSATLSCCNAFANNGGDWVGCIADQLGQNGNFSENPLFCLDLNPDDPNSLLDTSPCAPDSQPTCGLIGARPVGCTSLVDVSDSPPRATPVLLPSFPNPFNPLATIRFELPASSAVRLTVHGVDGRRVRTLVAAELTAGSHTVTWDGRDERGQAVAAGTYLCRLQAGGIEITRKMALVR